MPASMQFHALKLSLTFASESLCEEDVVTAPAVTRTG